MATYAAPADVRLTNAVANTVFVVAGLVLAAAALAWAAHQPVFALRGITVDGDLSRNSLATIRANAVPHLSGNFFSMNLVAARAAFETVPWVRRAVVRRVWPDRLAVTLSEHQVAALWESEDGEQQRLVNTHGELFDANLGDVEDDDLPVLSGPEGQAGRLLGLLHTLTPLLQPLGSPVVAMHQSSRGSVSVELDSGTELELGRGSDDELAARTQRFVATVQGVLSLYPGRALQYADLRHADGYAVRIKGVSTLAAPLPAPRPKPAPRPPAARQR